jgi:xylulokinase
VGQLAALVAMKLTGEWVMDPSQATFLGLWDIEHERWNRRICDLLGIGIASLPRVAFGDSVIGHVTEEMARRWAPVKAGTPVVGGFIDTDAATIQTPMKVGQLVNNVGSTNVLAMCLEKPQPAEGILTRPVGIGAKLPRRWLAVRTISAAGSALLWARQSLFPEFSDSEWAKMLEHAAREGAARGVRCEPNFSGQRAAIEQAVGATFSGITLATTREDLLGAIMQGIVEENLANYRLLAGRHRPEKVVHVMGGAGALAEAMQRAWPKGHRFGTLAEDSLAGLVKLARTAAG